MAEIWVPQGSLAYGELSPSVHGLVTTPQFQSGAHTLTNALLTQTGSARKRFGTEDIVSTTSGYPAALFFYPVGDRRFVIQFVSQDDDDADLNTAQRQVKVLDAETRAFINFAVNTQHGPFDSFGDTSAYHHHFKATELPEVYAFQDGTRIVFCHKNHPPIYLERHVNGAGIEAWKYGLVGDPGGPRVTDHSVPVNLSWDSATGKLNSDVDFFIPQDQAGVYRVLGAPADITTHPYGVWVQTGPYRKPTQMDAVILSGSSAPGADQSDWAGPYINNGTNFNTRITSGGASTGEGDSRQFTVQVSPFLTQNHIGTIIRVDGDTFWIITAVASSTVFTAWRISTSGGTVAESPTDLATQLCPIAIDANNNPGRRPWFQAFPTMPSARSGTITLYNPTALIEAAGDDDYHWLPENHETEFDALGATGLGGAVYLAAGIAQITAVNNPADAGGATYSALVRRDLPHGGPYLKWGVGWSEGVGFPRCGAAHQGRHIFGGFEFDPSVVVASKAQLVDDFGAGGLDGDGFNFRLRDPTGGLPTWMQSSEDLLIGTTTGEGAMVGSPITPTNLAWSQQTGYGGKNIPPLLVGSAALFVSGRGVREMAFLDARQRYEAPDLTDAAKHLFEGESIEQIQYVSHPHQVVYVRFASGDMDALSYWRENNVVGWSPFTQPAYPAAAGSSSDTSIIESMCAIRCSVPENDELWIVRKFLTGGQDGAGSYVRRIERMSPSFRMDQTVTDESPTTTQIDSGALFDELVGTFKPRVVLDGEDIGTWSTDGSGIATYATQGSTPDEGQIGRTIRFELVPLVQDPGDRSSGSLLGRISAVNALNVLLRESKGGFFGVRPIDPTLTEFTGWKILVGGSGPGRPSLMSLTHELAYHFEVCALNMKVSYG